MNLKRVSLFLLLCSMLSTTALAKETTFQVDDGYTPGERFARYKPKHPELKWPVMQYREGQAAEFERPFKSLSNRDLHIDTFFPSA